MLKLHKRMIAVLLTITMILSVIVVAPFTASAAGGVEDKIAKVRSVYSNGTYFTNSGGACYNSGGWDCKLSNIPSRGGLPSGSSVVSKTGDGYSCWAFANYVFYYVFGLKADSCSTVNISNVRIGDYLQMSSSYGTHYAIYIGQDSNYWYVYDSNGDSAISNKVLYTHACSKSSWKINVVRRASNYDSVNNIQHTHNYNTYVYYWKAHPHYSCYQCSCGDIQPNYSKTNYVNTCSECAVTNAWIKSSKTSLPVGDSNTFTFGATNASGYTIGIDKDGVRIITETISSGKSYTFNEAGEYTAYVTCHSTVNGGKNLDSSKITFTVFNPIILGDSFYANITNSKAGKNVSANDEGNVFIETKNDSDNQKWHFELQSDNSYKITNVKYNKCLDVEGSNVSNNTNVLVWDFTDKSNQRFYIRYNNVGYALIPKSCTNSAVDVYGGNTEDGTNIQQYEWNGSNAQTFSIEYLNLYPNEVATFNDNTYEYYDMTMTWNQAYRFCEKQGGHLVTIGSQEENDFVLSLASAYSDGFCWLGGTDFSSEGKWYWVNNEGFDYTNWNSPQPDNYQNKEHYLHMYLSDYYAGRWNDIPNDKNTIEGFVCEYENERIDDSIYIPTNTAYYNDSKYEVFDYSVDWDTARRICEAKGGHLVEINSQKENEAVLKAVQNTNKTEYWLGITDVSLEGVWTSADGEMLKYTNWLDTQPDNDFNAEEYALIRTTDGYWADLKSFAYSYHSIGFICEYHTDELEIQPREIIEVNGHTYMYFDTAVSWIQAYEMCEARDGHLVTINSKEENDLVLDLADNYSNERCWLGGTDYGCNGNWYWVNSEEFAYENWKNGEPNNDGGAEYFMNMWVHGDNAGAWNDAPYNVSGGFICEVDNVNAGLYTPVKTVVKDGKQYDVYDVSVDWLTAKKICQEKGGNLVSIENEEENTFIQSLVADTEKAEYWIGLNDIFSEGQWVWSDDTVTDYYPWVSGDPNNDFGLEDYGVFNKSNSQWFDLKGFAYAYHSIGFICESDLPLYGDANGDGEVNIQDATLVQMFVAKYKVDNFNEKLADCDQSGAVNIQDATAIQMKVAKLA